MRIVVLLFAQSGMCLTSNIRTAFCYIEDQIERPILVDILDDSVGTFRMCLYLPSVIGGLSWLEADPCSCDRTTLFLSAVKGPKLGFVCGHICGTRSPTNT